MPHRTLVRDCVKLQGTLILLQHSFEQDTGRLSNVKNMRFPCEKT